MRSAMKHARQTGCDQGRPEELVCAASIKSETALRQQEAGSTRLRQGQEILPFHHSFLAVTRTRPSWQLGLADGVAPFHRNTLPSFGVNTPSPEPLPQHCS